MRQAYEILLRLYPRDFRAAFSPEMLMAFERSAVERRAQGTADYIGFAASELIGLVIGAAREWIAKLTTDCSLRGRSLPDRRIMRPPGVPWEAYYGRALMDSSKSAVPGEVLEAQRRTEWLVQRMTHAIAHHDFEGARWYSYEECLARETLRLLREKYQNPDAH